MVSPYKRGYTSEREVMDILNKKGTPFRTAGSHGVFDVIFFSKRQIRLIQVKRVKGKYYSFKKDIEQIKKFNDYPKNTRVSKELWIRLDRLKGRKSKWEIKIIE